MRWFILRISLLAANHVAITAAEDSVAVSGAAVRAPQGQGDRRAQGEHVRRRQDRHGAQAKPAPHAPLRARPHQHEHEVRQEGARQDPLPEQVSHRERAQAENAVDQAQEHPRHSQTELEQDSGRGGHEGEGLQALGGRHGEPAELDPGFEVEQADLREDHTRDGARFQPLPRDGLLFLR